MWSDESRQIPDWIEEAYEVFVSHAADFGDGEGVPRDRAHELLVAHGEFTDEPADAKYAIERLIQSGWLYVVDDDVRITDPDS